MGQGCPSSRGQLKTMENIGSYTPSEANEVNKMLATSMGQKLTSVSPISSESCIHSEAAYSPRVVSIGPFHRGEKRLQKMEEHKWRDPIFDTMWILDALHIDMILLENQLPFFVLERLDYRTAFAARPSLLELTTFYFDNLVKMDEIPKNHYMPSPPSESYPSIQVPYSSVAPSRPQEKHFLHLLQSCYTPSFQWKPPKCHQFDKPYITSYSVLMDSLINTPNDVALLIGYGIFENFSGSNEEVALLFNNLSKEVTLGIKVSYFLVSVKT
ncbi:hypothetical protein HHK36_025772 [Tetracentron sinense]|uniref:Uncharacterized protein n=1 Tax=Tetracentron sinense TaxID=13715 RepID=A0A835D5W0_TETSI|nr:hypothetical protein HHK36_025772 [Tetracentron sinense]